MGMALFTLTLTLAVGCGRSPSMGTDREAFTTVDALFTAVSLKDEAQLDRNAAALGALHASGRLPERAYEALGAIIATAKGGDWESAGADLRGFMLDQRP